jgi:hypothetical protein
MLDGTLCHKAKMVTEYLQDVNVNTLPWPGNDPDMITENLCASVEREVKKMTDMMKAGLI